MARKARDERLDTRTARLRLAPRREPYFRTIQEGRAVGYRRAAGGKAGSWIARHYDPEAETPRRFRALGSADDLLDADGANTLNFGQAQDRARAWFDELARCQGNVIAPMTVKEAAEAYLKDFDVRGAKSGNHVRLAIKAHILPRLGGRTLASLATATIRAWHHEMAAQAPRLRTKAGATRPNTRTIDPEDVDAQRGRRATANNVLTILKAVLNFAFREGGIASDDSWRKVRPFPKVDAPRVRYLSDAESSGLINACADASLRRLVAAALLSGCRYQELARLRASDIDAGAGTLAIRGGKSGKTRFVALTKEALRFFESVANGRRQSDLLLPNAQGAAWKKSEQFRPLRAMCAVADISPAISFHILRHTYASRLAMRGVPMAVIAAQLGHSDLKLTARHYAHLSPGYVADTIRGQAGEVGIVDITPAELRAHPQS